VIRVGLLRLSVGIGIGLGRLLGLIFGGVFRSIRLVVLAIVVVGRRGCTFAGWPGCGTPFCALKAVGWKRFGGIPGPLLAWGYSATDCSARSPRFVHRRTTALP